MSLDAVQSAFPARPLTVSAPVGRWGNLLAGLAVIAMALGFGWWATASLVPTLLSDYEVRAGAVPVSGRLEGGRCSTRWGLLQTCDMTLVLNAPTKNGEPVRQAAEYIFVEPHIGNYSVQVMADPARPGRLTTDMGLDHLTNRAITFAVIAALMVFMLIGGLALLRASGRARRDMRALSGRRLLPVAVQVGRDGNGWQVTPVEGARATMWPMPKKAEPFWIDPVTGIALGVTAPGGPVFALDRDLAWADFTEEERDRLRAAAHA